MIARLKVLAGRAGTGKSDALFAALERDRQNGVRSVLIVPEQSTFEAERVLADRLGGLIGVQVLSFGRLCERVLSQHGHTRAFLSQQGYDMVIRRACMLHRAELTIFGQAAQKTGFAATLREIFSACKRASITPEDLANAIRKLPSDAMLTHKLCDIRLLYQETETYLSSRYLTEDDALHAACRLLPNSFLSDVPIYIDGIDRPSRRLFELIGALMETASDMTVTLRMDMDGANSGADDGDLFGPDWNVYRALSELAAKRGVRVEPVPMRAYTKKLPPSLRHLEQHLFAFSTARFVSDASAITVFGATDRRVEAEALAREILRKARAGVRFREMAVIVSDMDAYAGLIERAFQANGIAVFFDRKRPLTGHAAIDAVLSAMRAATGGYAAADVLRLAKTGYANVSEDDAEELELYLLRTGVRGSGLTKPFTRGEPSAAAERARCALVEPLERLREGLTAKSIRDKTLALYAYLNDIGLERQLGDRAEALLRAERIPLMEEHAQVWNLLTALMDQLVTILGDQELVRADYQRLLEEGLSGVGIGVIPDTADAVLLGDAQRTRSRSVKALFVVGANEGLLPRARTDDGIIDDAELTQLEATGLTAWGRSGAQSDMDRLDLYTALSKAKSSLYVSYALTADGAEQAPSTLVTRLLTLFPNCVRGTDLEQDDELPLNESAGLRLLTKLMRAYADGEADARLLSPLMHCLRQRPQYRVRVRRMEQAGQRRDDAAGLGKALSHALYGDRLRMSASRLEQFNQCPFKHFVRYGLQAADKREFTERAIDLGTFYHDALNAFLRHILDTGADIGGMTEAEADAAIDLVLPAVIASHNGGIFLHAPRLGATLFLIVNAVKSAARAILRQMQAGAFTPLGAEVRFGEGQAFPPITLTLADRATAYLSGVIDRVDAADTPDGRMMRIVDYKLGNRDFDFSGILHGLTLQLPLYLAAAMQGGDAAGMYYMPLRMEHVPEGEDVLAAAKEAFRLRGLTLSDVSVLLASDKRMEGGSEILKGVRRAPDGAYVGSLCTRGEMRQLIEQAVAVSEQTLDRMLSGEIAVSPAENACKYCDYRSVCRFDPTVRGNRTRSYPNLKQQEFFALIGGDAHAADD